MVGQGLIPSPVETRMTTVDVDSWEMVAEGGGTTAPAKDAPVDWVALKNRIFAGLDILAEYAALGVRFTGHGFNSKGVAECHAIDRPDESPSAIVTAKGLYVDRGNGGSQLDLIDFAVKHGSFGQWTAALKFFAEKAGVEVGRIAKKSGGRIREATYDYVDPQGEVRYTVFRYKTEKGGKSFSQHPPDGKGGHKFGAGAMDGVEPLPYRLADLVLSADKGESIFVVEGEKDADRLASLGLIATTAHGGAANHSKTWAQFDLAPFVGRDLVVIPDNDDAGRAYADAVARTLHPVARSIRVLTLPGLPAKGDASDWLDAGHDLDELGRLAHVAPRFDPAAVKEAKAPESEEVKATRDATLADIREQVNSEEWLWPGWIAGGVLCLIAAEGGQGKTREWMDLARRIYHGLPWPDETPQKPGLDNPRFVVVAADNNHRQLMETATEFGLPDEAFVLNAFAADPFGGTSLQTTEELDDLEARIVRVRPVFAVIDTITNTGDFKAQDASDAKRQYKPLQEIASRTGVPIICVTHLNAGGKTLGRRAVEKVRTVIQLSTPDPEGQPHRRKLWVEKSYAIKPPALGITMGVGGNEYDATPPEAPEEGERLNGAARGPVPAKTRECMTWLERRLRIGAAPVGGVRKEAEEADFSAKVLYRAKDELHVEETVDNGRKWWTLPAAALVNGYGEDHPF